MEDDKNKQVLPLNPSLFNEFVNTIQNSRTLQELEKWLVELHKKHNNYITPYIVLQKIEELKNKVFEKVDE